MSYISRQFLVFGLVGSAGFVVDAGTLQFLVINENINPYLGRLFSYLIAATMTWTLNRKFTFPAQPGVAAHHQWLRYLLANSIGALLNYGVYSVLIFSSGFIYHHLYFGVLAGAVIGLLFNFNLSRRWVFRSM